MATGRSMLFNIAKLLNSTLSTQLNNEAPNAFSFLNVALHVQTN